MDIKNNIDSNFSKVLNIDQFDKNKGPLKRLIIGSIIIVIVLIFIVLIKGKNGKYSIQYETKKVQLGNLTVTVTATGTLEPTNQVEVGSELSGIVKKVEVDFNDKVEIGQVLARLDTEKLKAQVLQSKALLASAKAKLLQAQATVMETNLKLKRLQEVYIKSNKKMPSQHELDTAEASLKRAKADETSAQAQVAEAKAKLEAIQTDLSKTLITSPINGIVLSRTVEPGQTVAASLQAPILFVLAEDLTKMELHVDVDEADVGKINEGQEAIFTVDAYQNQKFTAKIEQVRYAAKNADGVVTYETVLSVDNSSLLLRPGMTATADITVKTIADAVLIPNAALRFSPPERNNHKSNRSITSMILPRRPRRDETKQRVDKSLANNQQKVWTLKDGNPVSIPIIIGLSDGQMTELISGEVNPGLPLIVDILETKK